MVAAKMYGETLPSSFDVHIYQMCVRNMWYFWKQEFKDCKQSTAIYLDVIREFQRQFHLE